MPNINLIAVRREEKQRVTTLSRQLFMGFTASVVGLVCVFIWAAGTQVDKNIQIRNLDKQMAELQPKLDEINKLNGEIADLKPKVDTLDNAKVSTLRWRAMMGVMADAMPDTVWVDTMSTSGDIGSTSVSFSGTGPSQAVVGEYVRNLDATGVFTHVDLTSTNNGSVPEDPVQKVTFNASAFMLPAVLTTASAATPGGTPSVGKPSTTPSVVK
jgi:Tfp pilus assembly protein PilN